MSAPSINMNAPLWEHGPTHAEVNELRIDLTFTSDAFIVAIGNKPPWKLAEENNRAANQLQKSKLLGLNHVPPPLDPDPQPASPHCMQLLAGQLKVYCEGDALKLAAARSKFINHFSGIQLSTPTGVVHLGAIAGPLFDAAVVANAGFNEMKKAGLHEWGTAPGLSSLHEFVSNGVASKIITSEQFGANYGCVVKLVALEFGPHLEWSEMDEEPTFDRTPISLEELASTVRAKITSTYAELRGKRFVPIDPPKTYVIDALMHVAKVRKFHAMREFCAGLRGQWDGDTRLPALMAALNVLRPETGSKEEISRVQRENKLATAQVTKTLLGAVARSLTPGCKMDTMLVLKGGQGKKKSTFFKELTPLGRFTDAHLNIDSKDTSMLVRQNSIIEMAELSSVRRSEIEGVKAFLSRTEEAFRRPYARGTAKEPRHCIFVGTTNDDTPLDDNTGNRRFWILAVPDDGEVDIAALRDMKTQLWAELVSIYDAAKTCPNCAATSERRCHAHSWWLSPDEEAICRAVNLRFTTTEPLVDEVAQMVLRARATPKSGVHDGAVLGGGAFLPVKCAEVLSLLNFPPEKVQNSGLHRRAAEALKANGFTRNHNGRHGNTWAWPEQPNAATATLPPQSGATNVTAPPETESAVQADSREQPVPAEEAPQP